LPNATVWRVSLYIGEEGGREEEDDRGKYFLPL